MNVLLMHVFRFVLLLGLIFALVFNSGIAKASDQNANKASKTNQATSLFSSSHSNTKPEKIKLDYTQNDHTVTLLWQLPENFYLYKDRIRIQSTTPETLRIGKIDLPKGVVINDKTLGKQHVFYDQLNVHFKIYGQPQSDTRLKVQYQGCDGEVCLPLQTRQFPVENDGLVIARRANSKP
jgi:thiol:disulfide interchange protein